MDLMRTDCILREILEERKSLTGFFDSVFGFLKRNTDFFHIQKTKEDTIGFPRGIKEKILISCMQKYDTDYAQAVSLHKYEAVPPPVHEEVEIVSEEVTQSDNKELVSEVPTPPCLQKEILKPKSFLSSDYRNGAKFENYCWSQTMKDLELHVLLPPEVKSAKHVKLDLKANNIHIKSLIPKEQELVCGQMWNKVKHNEAVWTINDGVLVLSLDKSKEIWWDKFLFNENSIDVKKLDTERNIDEYPPELQSEIERIQIKNSINNSNNSDEFKTLPLTQSEQLLRLKAAWNAEGSPFKDQPFDPSVVKFS